MKTQRKPGDLCLLCESQGRNCRSYAKYGIWSRKGFCDRIEWVKPMGAPLFLPFWYEEIER